MDTGFPGQAGSSRAMTPRGLNIAIALIDHGLRGNAMGECLTRRDGKPTDRNGREFERVRARGTSGRSVRILPGHAEASLARRRDAHLRGDLPDAWARQCPLVEATELQARRRRGLP